MKLSSSSVGGEWDHVRTSLELGPLFPLFDLWVPSVFSHAPNDNLEKIGEKRWDWVKLQMQHGPAQKLTLVDVVKKQTKLQDARRDRRHAPSNCQSHCKSFCSQRRQ